MLCIPEMVPLSGRQSLVSGNGMRHVRTTCAANYTVTQNAVMYDEWFINGVKRNPNALVPECQHGEQIEITLENQTLD